MVSEIENKLDSLATEGHSILSEIKRVHASKGPHRVGAKVLSKLLVPTGYKRMARQIGVAWLDSSREAQLERLEGVYSEWFQRSKKFLQTIAVKPDNGKTISGKSLARSFSKTSNYVRSETQLRHGIQYLNNTKLKNPYIPVIKPKVKRKSRKVPEKVPFYPDKIVNKLPEPIRKSIEEARECYARGLYTSCAVMLRKALENAIVMRFELEGHTNLILRGDQRVITLPKLLTKAQECRLIIPQYRNELLKVKLLGDAAAHSHANEITKEDIDSILLGHRLALERIVSAQFLPPT